MKDNAKKKNQNKRLTPIIEKIKSIKIFYNFLS